MRLLKNKLTGNVFGYTELLADNPNMIEVRGVEANEPMEEVIIAKQKVKDSAPVEEAPIEKAPEAPVEAAPEAASEEPAPVKSGFDEVVSAKKSSKKK